MAEPESSPSDTDSPVMRRRRRRIGWPTRFALTILLLLVLILGWGWLQRERLADTILAQQLENLDLPAQYEIVSISPQKQVLANVVIGDPAQPDLTIERVEVVLASGLGLPRIGKVRLESPRLFGTYRDGQLSFGSLDPLFFPEESEEPFELPSMNLVLSDARGLLETEYGPIGLKADAGGNLRSGFKGILAATAPRIRSGGCEIADLTLYGNVAIDAERPEFSGPLRMGGVQCNASQIEIGKSEADLNLLVDRTFDGAQSEFSVRGDSLSFHNYLAQSLTGEGRVSWRDAKLTSDYELQLAGVDAPQIRGDSLGVDGAVRTSAGAKRVEIDATITGSGIRPGEGFDSALASNADSLDESLLGPIIDKIRAGLRTQSRSSTLAAELTVRKDDDAMNAVIPFAALRGTSGSTLLSLSGIQFARTADGMMRLSGNFATGGPGLPQIAGRMEQQPSGNGAVSLRMAAYSAGENQIAVPELALSISPDGSIGFAGRAIASGKLPGGKLRDLVLPLSGVWSSAGQLAMWNSCFDVRFDQLTYSSLQISRRVLQICPSRGRPILILDDGGARFAAGTTNLDLAGKLADTPIRLKAGAVGFAYPGVLASRGLDVRLGDRAGVAHFLLPELTARLDGDLGGSFARAHSRLTAVPLDISEAAGDWSYLDGILRLHGVSLFLTDREQVDRFERLVARDASLELADSKIRALVDLREPVSDRVVTRADIFHDLGSGVGRADLVVDNLVFDETLQPEAVTYLALGVVANTRGRIDGTGRIEWDPDGVSSRGTFSSEALDFAAAFGPVEGVSGTIEFTDLLAMKTAPDQIVKVRRMNPGIEVDDGKISYQLLDDFRLQINGGRWPFLGGTLLLQPGSLQLGSTPERRFTLELQGLDAAMFVQRMDLANLAVTGIFDGEVPLMFNENGGFIESGHLSARPPGGNLSYVGELTYADLPAMAKFSFDALKSLDYREMEVTMDGSLAGEIVTRVRFDGIRQGEGASRNFITQRIARLPIRFNVNIRAPFYKLITSVRSMYDPAFIRDPRELGLIDANGRIVDRPAIPAARPKDMPANESSVQIPESEISP